MAGDFTSIRSASYAASLLPWIVVHHFLPAGQLAEFSVALVEGLGGGDLRFGDLFEAQSSEGPDVLNAWLIQPKPVADGRARVLQEAVRVMAWQSDSSTSPAQHGPSGPEADLRNGLSAAFDLAHADCGTIESWLRHWKAAPDDLRILAETVGQVRDLAAAGAWPGLAAMAQGVRNRFAFPLSAILIKHLGDLAADVDCPALALELYAAAEHDLMAAQDPAWAALRADLSAIVVQSRAAMVRLTDGPAGAAAILNAALAASSIHSAALLHVNATLDAMEATHQANDRLFFFPDDTRPSIVWSPQIHLAREFSYAFSYQAEKKYRNANQRFWAGLRRLIAGGSANLTREAKAHYARCLLEELDEITGRHLRPDSFGLAVRLLLESGRDDLAKATNWSKTVLEAYLDVAAIDASIRHISHIKGARPERLRVFITIAGNWLRGLPHEKVAEAEALMDFLAKTARDEVWSERTGRDFAGAAFKAIEKVAEARPEFRRLAAETLVDAIIIHLVAPGFRSWIDALDVGSAVVDALTADPLRKLLDAILDRLEAIEPKTASWPVVRPALNILTDEAATNLWPGDTELARRSAMTILRYGLEQETERTRLLALLGTVNPFLPAESQQDPRINGIVTEIREQTRQINSTGVTANISALLASPAVSGLAGVADAVDGLRRILDSAVTDNASIAFAYAYSPLMMLTQRRDQIVADLGPAGADLDPLMRSLVGPLLAFWRAAANKPELMAPLSFPEPVAPNPVLVHNWTFASIGFARALGVETDLANAMVAAAANPLLAKGIATGRAARLTAGDPEMFDLDEIASEPAQAFYAALGQRVVILRDAAQPIRHEILEGLVCCCLRHGPNGFDAVVFMLARNAGAAVDTQSLSYRDYRDRLAANRDLRIGLTPILDDLVGPAEDAQG